MAGVGRQFPYPSVWNPDGQFDLKVSFTISQVQVPSVMCCPDGHPDGLGIPATGIGDGLE